MLWSNLDMWKILKKVLCCLVVLIVVFVSILVCLFEANDKRLKGEFISDVDQNIKYLNKSTSISPERIEIYRQIYGNYINNF